VSSSSAAAYITGMVRGATKSLVIDMAFLFEGQASHELPETLIGGMRLHHLDLAAAKKLDLSRELPLLQPAPSRRGPELLQQPRSMTGNHSRKNSAASDLELAAEALKGRLGKATPPAAPRSPAVPPSPAQQAQAAQQQGPAQAPPLPASPAVQQQQQQPGPQPQQQPQQQQPASATPPPPPRRRTEGTDDLLAGAARALAKTTPPPAQPIKLAAAAAAAADPPPAADAIKASSYPGVGPLHAAAEAQRAAADSPAGELAAEEGEEAPGSAGRASGGGRIKKFMQRHIRKLSGGSDADWASASYSRPASGHTRKTSVSSLNLGY
jgi:hypothetical protein